MRKFIGILGFLGALFSDLAPVGAFQNNNKPATRSVANGVTRGVPMVVPRGCKLYSFDADGFFITQNHKNVVEGSPQIGNITFRCVASSLKLAQIKYRKSKF